MVLGAMLFGALVGGGSIDVTGDGVMGRELLLQEPKEVSWKRVKSPPEATDHQCKRENPQKH